MTDHGVSRFFFSFWATFRRSYPVPYQLLVGQKPKELPLLRGFLLAVYGLLLGFLFHRLVLVNLDLPRGAGFYVGLTVALSLGVGCAFSTQIRCICALCLTGFLGKAGRNVLRTLTITLIVSGPVANVALNGQEVIRVLTCSAELAFNLTLTRVDLVSKPFQNALLQGRAHLPQLKREFSEIVSIVEPVVREVERPADEDAENGTEPGEAGPSLDLNEAAKDSPILTAADYQQMYVAKLNERCLAQLQTGAERCQQAFAKAYDECHEGLPTVVNALLCWPMKIDYVCSSAELFGVGTVCRMEDVLDADFGENYRLLRQTEHQLTGGVSHIEMDYDAPDLRSGYQ